MLNFDDYKNHDEFPKAPKYPSQHLITPDDYRNYATKLEKYKIEKQNWLNTSKTWAEKSAELDKKFKTDALKDIFGNDTEKFQNTLNKLWMIISINSDGNKESIYNNLIEYTDVIKAIKEDLQLC